MLGRPGAADEAVTALRGRRLWLRVGKRVPGACTHLASIVGIEGHLVDVEMYAGWGPAFTLVACFDTSVREACDRACASAPIVRPDVLDQRITAESVPWLVSPEVCRIRSVDRGRPRFGHRPVSCPCLLKTCRPGWRACADGSIQPVRGAAGCPGRVRGA